MQKFYRDNSGNYIGSFDGDTGVLPVGAIEIDKPPEDARMIWDGSAWNMPAPLKEEFAEEKQKFAVDRQVTLEDKIKALWFLARGDDTEFKRIDAIILKAEQDFPKAP